MIVQDPTQAELNERLATEVQAIIETELEQSRAGQCLRVTALPEAVMRDLCATFNAEGVKADVVLLIGPRQYPSASWQVTATRLIELRNAEKRPLIAFIPPGLKA